MYTDGVSFMGYDIIEAKKWAACTSINHTFQTFRPIRRLYASAFGFHHMFILILSLILLTTPQLSMAQSQHELRVVKAEELIARGSLPQAIEIYELALSDLLSGKTQYEQSEIGKIHSRLGQLYIKSMLRASNGDFAIEFQAKAALHYLKCVQVKELSSIIRERVCAPKVEELLTPLRVIGDPHHIEVLHPAAFRGKTGNGRLLPRGLISISYRKNESSLAEQRLIKLPQERPLDFTERSYMPPRPLLNSSNGLVLKPVPNSPEYKLYQSALEAGPNQGSHIPMAPGILMTGIGVGGLITGGVIQGLDIYVPMGDQGVKALYIAGSVLTALGAGWLTWAW